MTMSKDNENFTRIMEGLGEASAFVRGEADEAGYRVHAPEDVDVRAIRARMHLTREQFAVRFGFPKGTVRDWEQGRRKPEASARVLLRMIEKSPGIWRIAVTDPEFLRERVKVYRVQRRAAEGTLRRLERGMRFFEAAVDEPMHEVTEKRREEVERQIALFDELISTYEAPLSVIVAT